MARAPGPGWALATLFFVIVGCSPASSIGKDQTDAAFPAKSQSEIEAELKKDPKAWAEYEAAQKRDASRKTEDSRP